MNNGKGRRQWSVITENELPVKHMCSESHGSWVKNQGWSSAPRRDPRAWNSPLSSPSNPLKNPSDTGELRTHEIRLTRSHPVRDAGEFRNWRCQVWIFILFFQFSMWSVKTFWYNLLWYRSIYIILQYIKAHTSCMTFYFNRWDPEGPTNTTRIMEYQTW